ncbi:MAG: hypothetical protein WDN48_07460 [Pseudolabrys sp.]
MTLGLVGGITTVMFTLVWEFGLAHGALVYLIPVVIAATRWGIVSSITAASAGYWPPPSSSIRRFTASASRIRRKSSTSFCSSSSPWW